MKIYDKVSQIRRKLIIIGSEIRSSKNPSNDLLRRQWNLQGLMIKEYCKKQSFLFYPTLGKRYKICK